MKELKYSTMPQVFKLLILLLLVNTVLNYPLQAQPISAVVSIETTSPKDSFIFYKEGIRLKFSDFRAAMPQGTNNVAMTYSGISIAMNGVTKKDQLLLTIKLSTKYYPYKSWFDKNQLDSNVLQHEQRHFDISAINTLALCNAFRQFHFSENFKHEIDSIYQHYLKKNRAMQKLYDSQTQNGILEQEQDRWNQNIDQQLQHYYAKP